MLYDISQGRAAFPALARQAGEKDALEPLAQERGDVPVRELGGVADRLRGHGRHELIVLDNDVLAFGSTKGAVLRHNNTFSIPPSFSLFTVS